MADYAKTQRDTSIGGVQGRQVRQYVIDINGAVDSAVIGYAEEIIVRMNGRPLKRMNMHAADRAGLVIHAAGY